MKSHPSRTSSADEGPGAGRDAFLRVRNLTKTYSSRGRGATEAISSIDLDIADGEFLSVVGPSGCGKTTLLKIIAGLVPASAGSVSIGEVTVRGPIQDFGMVFQSPTLLPWRSALDNVLLPIEMMGLSKKDHIEAAHALLSQVGLDGFAHRRPGELSGGMQQRVALCRSLIHDPRILLMDEPFAAVDEFTREQLNDRLLDLWSASRKTVIFITHNVMEAVYLSDRVAVMTRRPSMLAGIQKIMLPRPRRAEMRYDEALIAHARKVQDLLKASP